MIEDQVGELRLRVRTDVADPERIRLVAERFVRSVLERCAALLEQRAPGRIVLVRRLPLRLRLDESALDDAAQVEELARSAAESIERSAPSPTPDYPSQSEDVVFFDDEPHMRASHLVALARGGPAWFHGSKKEGASPEPLLELAKPGQREIAVATLSRLGRTGFLAEVLASRPETAIVALATAIGADIDRAGENAPWPETTLESRNSPAAATSALLGKNDAALHNVLPHDSLLDSTLLDNTLLDNTRLAMAADWPSLSRAARGLVLFVHARLLLGTSAAESEVFALAKAALSRLYGSPLQNGIALADATHPSVDVASPLGGKRSESAAVTGTMTVVDTRCAGLFYLLDRVKELGLGEALWKACLPESAILTCAARALLQSLFAEDPAPALFGGADGLVPCPEVLPEQHAEIALFVAGELAAAFPRRGLAKLPSVVLARVGHPTGPMLVALAEGFPFAFFAWPADTPAALLEGLQQFLGVWPYAGPLVAMPALAALDTSGRVRPRLAATPSVFLFPEAPSAPAAALLTLLIGAPCQLFAGRASAPPFRSAEAFLEQFVSRRAHIEIWADQLQIVQRADHVDFDVRRAGLDRDPGWIPWLKRNVMFRFEEVETQVLGDSQ